MEAKLRIRMREGLKLPYGVKEVFSHEERSIDWEVAKHFQLAGMNSPSVFHDMVRMSDTKAGVDGFGYVESREYDYDKGEFVLNFLVVRVVDVRKPDVLSDKGVLSIPKGGGKGLVGIESTAPWHVYEWSDWLMIERIGDVLHVVADKNLSGELKKGCVIVTHVEDEMVACVVDVSQRG